MKYYYIMDYYYPYRDSRKQDISGGLFDFILKSDLTGDALDAYISKEIKRPGLIYNSGLPPRYSFKIMEFANTDWKKRVDKYGILMRPYCGKWVKMHT